ncbi:MAG: polymer-forming cytoskeletal protein [Alphaproteobacteria bacterium]|nr:polymer-forming cytoskeletal protein [Alphaproteobacteria bacterium]
MFGRKQTGAGKDGPEVTTGQPTPPLLGGAGDNPEPSRAQPMAAPRPAVVSVAPARPTEVTPVARPVMAKPEPPRPEPAKSSQVEGKKLLVGKDIYLSGEITACDLLIVEGRIEATLKNSVAVEIAESGTFKGTAEIEKADVSGVFEGDLTVRDRLILRRSGRVRGKLRYGSIQIEPGGEISGSIEILPKPAVMAEVQAATGD